MKIGIYTDVHCSFTSSILPTFEDGSKYTTRLQMIIDTFRWMYNIFEKHNVDIIVNCGDLFDSYNVRAEELSAMSEALKFGGNIPELHILGNHEILDKHRMFNAVALLDNYSHIDVITDPVKLKCGISLLPYCTIEEATDIIPYLSNDILFSHIDIKGSFVTPQYALDVGVEPTRLSNNFKRVINGHLHSPQSFGACVHNIGASTSLSFSDNSDYIPRITILDTDSLTLTYESNPHAIRFIKRENSTVEELQKLINSLTNRAAIRVKCKLEDKPQIAELFEDSDKVVAHRIITEHSTATAQAIETDAPVLEHITDVDSKFLEFLETCNELKYPMSEYQKVIAKACGGVTNEN